MAAPARPSNAALGEREGSDNQCATAVSPSLRSVYETEKREQCRVKSTDDPDQAKRQSVFEPLDRDIEVSFCDELRQHILRHRFRLRFGSLPVHAGGFESLGRA